MYNSISCKSGKTMQAESTDVFSFRPMGIVDIDRISTWFTDFEDVGMFDRNVPLPVNIEHMRQTWSKSLEYSSPPKSLWFIVEDHERNPAAICGLELINYINGDSTVPIFVGKNMRGKGLAIAMSLPLIDIAFGTLRLHRLTTYFREDNIATKAIVSKMGFKEEGRLREAWYSNGKHKDLIQVGLLNSEWPEVRSAIKKKLETTRKVTITLHHDLD